MSPLLLLAHTREIGYIMFIAGIATMVISAIWLAVLSCSHGIWFILGVIFIPFFSLILFFIDKRARFVVLLYALGFGVGVWSIYGVELPSRPGMAKPKAGYDEYLAKGEYLLDGGKPPTPLLLATEAHQVLLDRQTALADWYRTLDEKRTALKPNDAAGLQAFNDEAQQYAQALAKLRADQANDPIK